MARRTVKEVSTDLDKLIDKCETVRQSITALELKLSLLKQKTENIEKNLNGVLGGISWAWRAVAGIMLAALLAFILRGGLVL